MLARIIVAIIGFSVRYAWYVVAATLFISIMAGGYAATHFAINTDINKLISPDLPWRQREIAFSAQFPQRHESIVAVVDAPTPELAALAADALVKKLAPQTNLFTSVAFAGGGEFFLRNGFLFLSQDELNDITRKLGDAGPLIGSLGSDPSIRGLLRTLSFGLGALRSGQLKLDEMNRPLTMSADTLENVLANRPASFSWKVLLTGKPATESELRQIIQIRPILDYSALEPGRVPSEAIRKAAAELNFAEKYQARLRLTGPVPIADEEFSTVKEGAVLNTLLTILAVLIILWLALRSARIIFAVFVSLFVGLSITAAIGLMMVGALNMISVSFAVLFIGLGVDFGIQYSVRYRAERHDNPDLRDALLKAGEYAGAPLTLAAAAVAAGFFSFLPTAYKGVSELGLIAGVGMLIALLTSITLLPAMLSLLKPPGEPEPMGYAALAPVDSFMERHRIPIIAITGLVVAAGLPLLYWLRFDFNPINLRSAKVESIATYLDLRRDPNTASNAIQVLAASSTEAATVAEKLGKLPEVRRVMTVQNFVPSQQAEKLATIRNAQRALEGALRARPAPPPSDAENVAALKTSAEALTQAAGNATGTGAQAARRLAAALTALANADPATRSRAQAIFIEPFQADFGELRARMQAQTVTLASLPRELSRDWIAPDGRARVEVVPAGDPNDNENLRAFARAVLAVEPRAVEGPISILEAGNAIVWAFIQAGFWALLSISILLYITLQRIGDVLLTLIPLILAGVVTLEICVLIGMPMNFANIIALPLLLGVGVAFKIYYIMAWRAGQTNLLQTSLTRAVIFSALTTVTAFGSLYFSSHPGTSSMGELLAMSLICTLAAAVLFQPVLMGKPRDPAEEPAPAAPVGAGDAAKAG